MTPSAHTSIALVTLGRAGDAARSADVLLAALSGSSDGDVEKEDMQSSGAKKAGLPAVLASSRSSIRLGSDVEPAGKASLLEEEEAEEAAAVAWVAAAA